MAFVLHDWSIKECRNYSRIQSESMVDCARHSEWYEKWHVDYLHKTILAGEFMVYLLKRGVGTAIWERSPTVLVPTDDDVTNISCIALHATSQYVIETCIVKNDENNLGSIKQHSSFEHAVQYIHNIDLMKQRERALDAREKRVNKIHLAECEREDKKFHREHDKSEILEAKETKAHEQYTDTDTASSAGSSEEGIGMTMHTDTDSWSSSDTIAFIPPETNFH